MSNKSKKGETFWNFIQIFIGILILSLIAALIFYVVVKIGLIPQGIVDFLCDNLFMNCFGCFFTICLIVELIKSLMEFHEAVVNG